MACFRQAAEWYRKALAAGYEPNEEEQARLKDMPGKEETPK